MSISRRLSDCNVTEPLQNRDQWDENSAHFGNALQARKRLITVVDGRNPGNGFEGAEFLVDSCRKSYATILVAGPKRLLAIGCSEQKCSEGRALHVFREVCAGTLETPSLLDLISCPPDEGTLLCSTQQAYPAYGN
jgi:hypothetical protein